MPLALFLVAVIALAGCAGGGDEAPALSITREDGSVVEIDGTLRAWCGVAPFQGKDVTPGRSLHVLGGDREFADPDDVPSYWIFRIELEQLEQTTRLPVPQVPVDTTSWVFFVNDVERDNEVATYKEESSGFIEVEAWGCDEGDVVTLTVDARVASEYGLGALRVRGTATAEIGDEPDGYNR